MSFQTPIARYLSPPVENAIPAEYVEVNATLAAGIPATLLDSNFQISLLMPCGEMRKWLDLDPLELVSDSSLAFAPHEGEFSYDWDLPCFRIIVKESGITYGVAPLLPMVPFDFSEGPGAGPRCELIVADWKIYAGTIRGAGSFGSYVRFGWRDAAAGQDSYILKPVPVSVVNRPGQTEEPIQSFTMPSPPPPSKVDARPNWRNHTLEWKRFRVFEKELRRRWL